MLGRLRWMGMEGGVCKVGMEGGMMWGWEWTIGYVGMEVDGWGV